MDILKERYHQIADYARESADASAVYRLKSDYHRINFIAPIARAFPFGSAIRVLEFGPGMGCFAELVHAHYPNVEYHAVDVDRAILEEVAARFGGIHVHAVEGEADLDQIEGRFDVIIAIDVWEHLSKDTALAYTTWCYSRLKPGGHVILQVPNWGCPVTPSVFPSDLTHQLAFNEKSMRQLFRASGIPDEEFKVIGRKTPYLLGRVRDALMALFSAMYRLVFIFFGTARLRVFTADLVAIVKKPSR